MRRDADWLTVMTGELPILKKTVLPMSKELGE